MPKDVAFTQGKRFPFRLSHALGGILIPLSSQSIFIWSCMVLFLLRRRIKEEVASALGYSFANALFQLPLCFYTLCICTCLSIPVLAVAYGAFRLSWTEFYNPILTDIGTFIDQYILGPIRTAFNALSVVWTFISKVFRQARAYGYFFFSDLIYLRCLADSLIDWAQKWLGRFLDWYFDEGDGSWTQVILFIIKIAFPIRYLVSRFIAIGVNKAEDKLSGEAVEDAITSWVNSIAV